MHSSKLALLAIAAVLVIASPSLTRAQTDAERLIEARLAIDKYKDCAGARAALLGVPEVSPARKDALWVYYMARSYECTEELSDLESAIEWYEEYEKILPGQSEITEKLVDLRYRKKRKEGEIGRQNREEASKEEQRKLEEARMRDLSGLWKRGSDYFRITETADEITAIYEKVSPNTRENNRWLKGDVKFKAKREGNNIVGTFFVHLNSNDYYVEKCAEDLEPSTSVKVRFAIEEKGMLLRGIRDEPEITINYDAPNYGGKCIWVTHRNAKDELLRRVDKID
jgi:hypothetical protein